MSNINENKIQGLRYKLIHNTKAGSIGHTTAGGRDETQTNVNDVYYNIHIQ